MIAVILHHARNILIEHGVRLSSAKSMPLPWHILMQLWHQVTAHMLADGVPAYRMPVGGPIQLTDAWRRCRHRLSDFADSKTVARWRYDPFLDNMQVILPTRSKSSRGRPADSDHEDEMQHETLVLDELEAASETTQENVYEWPSETGRFEAITSAIDVLALIGAHKTEKSPQVLDLRVKQISPCELGQHRPSTFRVLIHIMRDYHQEVFSVAENVEILQDRDF